MTKKKLSSSELKLKKVAKLAMRKFATKEEVSATLKGSYKVVSVTADAIVTENPASGTEVDVIYTNNTASAIQLTISAQTYRTPLGTDIVLIVPAGGYAEANFSNIAGTVYVRGV